MTKTRSTKRALLVSALSLLLSVSMLVGSTFAWFTDSVASGSNVIQSGNLDIAVEYTLDGENWADLDGATDLFQKGLWEPGHTEVLALKIENKGSLALKYAATMNIFEEKVGKTKDGADIVLSDILTVSTLTQQANDAIGVGDIALMLAYVGENSLAYQTTASFKDGNIFGQNQSLMPGDAYYVFVKVDMAETVGNEANHDGVNIPEINFGLNIVATQYTHESDSFGNQYDANAEYPTLVNNATELSNAIAAGGKYVLAADIEADANTAIAVAAGKEVVLDLNGHKLSATASKTGNQELFLVKGNMTVKNGELELTAQNNQGWGAMATIFDVTAGGVLNLEGVTAAVSGTDMNFIAHLNNWGSATLNVSNCDFTASYVAIRVFNSGNDMNNVTVTDTDFHGGRVFWVHNYTSEGKDDSTLNLNIYGNGNTTDNAKPVRFGFNVSTYFDIDGNEIV